MDAQRTVPVVLCPEEQIEAIDETMVLIDVYLGLESAIIDYEEGAEHVVLMKRHSRIGGKLTSVSSTCSYVKESSVWKYRTIRFVEGARV